MKPKKIYMAPMQGYTDAVFRHCHALTYGAVHGYFTPFVRMDGPEVRSRDLRDVCTPLNHPLPIATQIIFRNILEFNTLCATLQSMGVTRIDLNMGCPFVPQVRKGRGAGTIPNLELLQNVAKRIEELPSITFSVKMRLGIDLPDEWTNALPLINSMKLCHVTVHPRTARQQYGGQLHTEQFLRIAHACVHPLIFNGDISTPRDITSAMSSHPNVAGVMIGRGLLQRPSIAAEWTAAEEWSRPQRVSRLLQLHERLLAHAEANMCGEHQALSKMHSYWEYWKTEFPKKPVKEILKAKTISRYRQIVNLLD